MVSVLVLAGCSTTIYKVLSIALVSLLTTKCEVWVRVLLLLANCIVQYKTAKQLLFVWVLVYSRAKLQWRTQKRKLRFFFVDNWLRVTISTVINAIRNERPKCRMRDVGGL